MQGTRFLRQAVACQPNGVATVSGSRQRRWKEVGDRVPRLAAALRSIRWSSTENGYAMTDSHASVLFVDESFVDQARELKAQLDWVKTLVFMGEGETPEGMIVYEDLIARHEPMEDANRGGEDLWVIFYTAGTTSHPKGVMMSHRALFVATLGYIAMLPDIDDLKFLYVAGLFHFAGASALLYVTMLGGTHVLLPKFDAVPVMKAVSEHGVTNMVLVPTMINMLVRDPEFERYDLSSLRTCIYGGSPMPEALMLLAISKLRTWRFYQIFGMTETGGFATMLRWRDHRLSGPYASRVRSGGQPAPGNEVRILLPDGSYAPPNTLGEIVVRSNSLMSGYLNNPQATAAVLKDGWMHTGDAGTIDEDGFLFVADRVKDMIVTGGENVYSIEVERALFLHPAVREAAVIGVPNEQWGESVHAVVVLNEGESATPEG